ncbi:MAG: serine/threonine-protein kinase [Myxococcota bacterium]
MASQDLPDLGTGSHPVGRARAIPFAGGRYGLVREIGRGGTSVVHLARDNRSGLWVAIKVLAPKFAVREDLRQRFRRECEAMSQIVHPAVLRVMTWGITDGSMFLVTEFAPGGSIGSWVRRHGPMSPRRAVDVTRQVCLGVSAAHQIGVVHRDVKPDNVLIGADGRVRVCDFGIAQVRAMDERPLTRTGTSIGTFGFMAPEQGDHARDVDLRADVYSIAATLWFLLRGAVPPYAFRTDPFEDEIPGPLCPILARATHFSREQRHADLQTLHDDLAAVQERLPADPADAPPLITEAAARIDLQTVPSRSGASDEPEPTWLDYETGDGEGSSTEISGLSPELDGVPDPSATPTAVGAPARARGPRRD